MILPLRGHHIADVRDNHYNHPSVAISYYLTKHNDLAFYGAGHLGYGRVSSCRENALFRKHIEMEPARPLFYWKHSFIIEGINNDDQTD